MITSMILVCKATACTVIFSNLFYEDEYSCQLSQINGGSVYILQNYPDADYVEFYCHKWTGPKEDDPA